MIVFIIVMIIPFFIGRYFKSDFCNSMTEKGCYIWLSGFFFMLALWEVISVPACFLKVGFTSLCVVYSIVLLAILIIKEKSNCSHKIRFKLLGKKAKSFIKSLSIWETVYILAFFILLSFQLINLVRLDIGWWNSDDATYIGYASTALQTDRMYLNDPMTGNAMLLDVQRSLQGFLLFIAYLSKITGISAVMMAHTVFAVVLVVASYMAAYLVACGLFRDRENRFLFLCILCVLYIFGYYSEYSLTFRLLGAIWQGKAVLAVVLSPFVFYVYQAVLNQEYQKKYGVLLLMLSVASISLSMAGAIFTVGFSVIVFGLFMVLNRKIMYLKYILFSCAFPAIIAGIYLIIR